MTQNVPDAAAGTRVGSRIGHFGRVPMVLLEDGSVSDAECRLYAWLTTWDFARTGRMFHGREAIAAALSWSLSKVDRNLLALEKRGAIRRTRRGLGMVNYIDLLADVVGSDGTELSDLTGTDLGRSDGSHKKRELKREPIAADAADASPSSAEEESMSLDLDVPPREKKTRKRTARDDFFDALEREFPASTPPAKSLLGKVSSELIGAGCTAEQVPDLAAWCKRTYSGKMPVTARALSAHFDDWITATGGSDGKKNTYDGRYDSTTSLYV